MQPGDSILLTVAEDWHVGACTLLSGTTLHARVLAVERYSLSSRHTAIALQFSTSCDEQVRDPLTWISLLAPTQNLDPSAVSIPAFRSSTFGEGGNGRSTGISRSADTPDMTGHQNPNLPAFLQPAADPKERRPTQVLPGEVWHLPDVSLAVAAGPEGSTILASSKKSLRIPAHALFVLRSARASEVIPHERIESRVRDVVTLPKEQLSCTPPLCTTLSATWFKPRQPDQSISLERFGCKRLHAGEMRSLSSTAAMALLGDDQLLVTFDSHALTSRHTADRLESRPRMVRAVLIQLPTHLVLRCEDWRIPDSTQYLWQEPGGEVLLHKQDRLVWLGRDLEEKRSLPVSGPISFIRESSDREHLLVGIIHELHSRQEHAELFVNDGIPPQEQVDLESFSRRAINDAYQFNGTSYQSSRALAPTLTNAGEITVLRGEGEMYHLRLVPWSGPSHTFAVVRSACLPHLSSTVSDLVFVTGCDAHVEQRWFRVLRADGSVVSRGSLNSQQLPPLTTQGTATEKLLPIGIPLIGSGWAPSSSFHASDITGEELYLLQAETGALVLSTRVQQPALTTQPYALDILHQRLIAFDSDGIDMFALPSITSSVTQGAAKTQEYRRYGR